MPANSGLTGKDHTKSFKLSNQEFTDSKHPPVNPFPEHGTPCISEDITLEKVSSHRVTDTLPLLLDQTSKLTSE